MEQHKERTQQPTKLLATTTIADVLNHFPCIYCIVIKHRMACIGCPMAQFDTLSDVATNYHLSPAALLAELQHAINTHTQQQR